LAQVLLDGLKVGESPRWHDGRLWLCHWGAGEVLAVDMSGEAEVVARVQTTIPFSIDWLPERSGGEAPGRDRGRLLIVSGPERRLLDYADLGGLPATVFNEIVVDGRGNAFVNGGFGFDGPWLIAVVTPDGQARQVAEGVKFPNGMAITADDSTLIVAESYGRCLTAFDIAPDGGLSNRRTWADCGDGVPDGICIDAEGAVWYADVPNRRCVRVREGGEVLDTVQLDRGCFACMLGGDDGRTLFILAAEWLGAERMFDGPPAGQVVVSRAPAAHAGRP
jgi:sugar lactone lactonase YvrE